ncbi:MAG: hypothetical protein IJD74_07795 [Clostridia bacterium]|nr:hypothetical protein [Clostridia bacterium]
MSEQIYDKYLEGENIIYIENEHLKLGANLALGGALTYLAEKGKKNLINSSDWGRQVQMSFYAPPVPFHPDGVQMAENWKFIGWNPIQSGDYYRNRSRVLDYRCENNEIYVKCIPMHWPLNNHPGECTFEVWYRLDGYCVNVTSRINNARPDTTQYPARHQEMPAVYTNGEWYKGVSYIGKEPFTDGELTELVTKENGLGWPWLNFIATENWSALVDDNNYGLGVYIGVTNLSKIGFFGEKGWGGPKDSQTGYIAPLAAAILDHDIVYSYDYSLIVGDVSFIREVAKQKDKLVDRKKYSFEYDRNQFYYHNISDKGWRTGGCLEFDFKKASELKSPAVFIGKGECKKIKLDACLDGEILGEIVFNLYKGLDEKNCFVLEHKKLPFNIVGNGERKIFDLDISDVDDCFVGFSLRFANEGHLKLYSVELA